MIRFPVIGCIVEFLQGNRIWQAIVLGEQSGTLRLYALSKREASMPLNRVLPWYGAAVQPLPKTKEEMQHLLEETHKKRELLKAEVDPVFLWEIAHAEKKIASPQWFAEVLWNDTDTDKVAAVGAALLTCKTHFKFTGSDFEIFDEEKVKIREREQELAQKRESIVTTGVAFINSLWENHLRKLQGKTPEPLPFLPEENISILKDILWKHMAENDDHEVAFLWKELTKSLPDLPNIAFLLLEAWGVLPAHYNYSLDKIGYATNEDWYAEYSKEIEELIKRAKAPDLELVDLPFISVDASDTIDVDDAFHITQTDNGGYELYLAIACPTLAWPFGSEFDKAVLRRGSSLYLPEGNLHMLPPELGINTYGLKMGTPKPVVLCHFKLTGEGEVTELDVMLRRIEVSASYTFDECENILSSPDDNEQLTAKTDEKRAHRQALRLASTLASTLEARRIENGAVIIRRPDPKITLHEENNQIVVNVSCQQNSEKAQLLIGEMMVLLNSSLPLKAKEWQIPLIYRTQDVVIPKAYSGVWTKPEDIARVVEILSPADISVFPKPHAGLGLAIYATTSSPLRRYIDIFNQGQIVSWLQTGKPAFSKEQLESLLPFILTRAEAVSTIQKQRPRYWKLLYFKQQGDKKWHNAILARETDSFANIFLPAEQMQLRTKRSLLGEKVMPGDPCKVRIGKVNPLNNEIQILAVEEA